MTDVKEGVIQFITEDSGPKETPDNAAGATITIVSAASENKEKGETVVGTNFSVSEDSATFFNKTGTKLADGRWEMPGAITPVYDNPKNVLSIILGVIDTDVRDGNFNNIHRVVISIDAALGLVLSGVLTPDHFKSATEAAIDTTNFFPDGDGVTEDPAITLEAVPLGKYTLRVSILESAGDGTVATVDKSGKMV